MDLSKLDLMINDALLIIYRSEFGMVYSDEFTDENGIKLSRYNGDKLGKIMEDKGLVKKQDNAYTLKSLGVDIVESGGYLKYRNNDKGNIKDYGIQVNIDKSKKIKKVKKVDNRISDNSGLAIQGSRLENSAISEIINTTKAIPSKKEPTSIWMQIRNAFMEETVKAIIGLLITATLIYFGIKAIV